MRFNFGFRFHFRAVPFIATLLVMAVGIGLGQWQMRRADMKRAIQVKLSQRSAEPVVELEKVIKGGDELEYRRVRLTGKFLSQWPLYLDNRPHLGHAGLYVLMPFQLAAAGRVILVQRGWVARNLQDRKRLPTLITSATTMTIEGQVRKSAGNVMQIGQVAPLIPGAIVQNLDLGTFEKASGLAIEPFIVQQTSANEDELVRDWPLPSSGIERHLGYAFQWYALTVMAGLFFVVTGFKRAKSAK